MKSVFFCFVTILFITTSITSAVFNDTDIANVNNIDAMDDEAYINLSKELVGELEHSTVYNLDEFETTDGLGVEEIETDTETEDTAMQGKIRGVRKSKRGKRDLRYWYGSGKGVRYAYHGSYGKGSHSHYYDYGASGSGYHDTYSRHNHAPAKGSGHYPSKGAIHHYSSKGSSAPSKGSRSPSKGSSYPSKGSSYSSKGSSYPSKGSSSYPSKGSSYPSKGGSKGATFSSKGSW
jgi:hypothetical protein